MFSSEEYELEQTVGMECLVCGDFEVIGYSYGEGELKNKISKSGWLHLPDDNWRQWSLWICADCLNTHQIVKEILERRGIEC